MNFKNFKNKIEDLQFTELGGVEAQFKMAPELRLQYNKAKIIANKPRKAAVLALFYPNKNNETALLLTQRASYKGVHSAQISFPGGKTEKADTNLRETAIRETFEEVGVHPSSIEIIRELTDVYIPPSNFLATPFLGFVDEKPEFILNHEVATIIEILVSDLLNERNSTKVNLNTSYMKNTEVPCFKIDGHIIWGATGMMLSEIKELLK
ncbi:MULTISPECIES: NUDIX hydrolase [unclassified Polaribacter]|uniref:NUDIX hydrolase n=1 Tax=unclassified Polaribacter TaxID=196858 RepID=UPI0011BF7B4E|nr:MULTISPECIES: CoA pyrophosphatase [unclassified Polaribacter]TXD47393.1 CoA pyrophosphatase [Polaribacter sp. IC063]TXD55391.1 CoA pyrophosphatase [Polaribacter sp. IC066]